jgi:hypothetical protein
MVDVHSDRCDWILVSHDGHRTLYQVIEMGKEADILRLAGDLPAPAIVVDIALPALPAVDRRPDGNPGSLKSKLVLLNVRTAAGNDANGVVRVVRQQPTSVRTPDAASAD